MSEPETGEWRRCGFEAGPGAGLEVGGVRTGVRRHDAGNPGQGRGAEADGESRIGGMTGDSPGFPRPNLRG